MVGGMRKPYYDHAGITIYHGDALTILKEMEAESINCVITSPPYWGLRDYGIDGQLGLEATPELYVSKMLKVFQEIRRVLKTDGTVWLNLGDSYFGSGQGWSKNKIHAEGKQASNRGSVKRTWLAGYGYSKPPGYISSKQPKGLKPKDLVGIPWRVAFALQTDGWWLRSDIIWAKPNPMPESVADRPTKTHEYIFLLTKSKKYYFDQNSVKTLSRYPEGPNSPDKIKSPYGQGFSRRSDKQTGFNERWDQMSKQEQRSNGANIRTVWNIATMPYLEAHFATFPEKLIEPCILAGCPSGGVVLDPFSGSGTALAVSKRLGRLGIGIELKKDYINLSKKRLSQEVLDLK